MSRASQSDEESEDTLRDRNYPEDDEGKNESDNDSESSDGESSSSGSSDSSDDDDGSTSSDSPEETDKCPPNDQNEENLNLLDETQAFDADPEIGSNEGDQFQDYADEDVPTNIPYQEQAIGSVAEVVENHGDDILPSDNDEQYEEHSKAYCQIDGGVTKPLPNSTYLIYTDEHGQPDLSSMVLLSSNIELNVVLNNGENATSQGQLNYETRAPSLIISAGNPQANPIPITQNVLAGPKPSLICVSSKSIDQPSIPTVGYKTIKARAETQNNLTEQECSTQTLPIEMPERKGEDYNRAISNRNKKLLDLNFVAKSYRHVKRPKHGLKVEHILTSILMFLTTLKPTRWKDMFNPKARRKINFCKVKQLYWGNYKTNKEFPPWCYSQTGKATPTSLEMSKIYDTTSEKIGRYCHNNGLREITAALLVKLFGVRKKSKGDIKEHLGSELFAEAESILNGEHKEIWDQTISLPVQFRKQFPRADFGDEDKSGDKHDMRANDSGRELDEHALPQVDVNEFQSHAVNGQNPSKKNIIERLKSVEKFLKEKQTDINTLENILPVLKPQIDENLREVKQLQSDVQLMQEGDYAISLLPGMFATRDVTEDTVANFFQSVLRSEEIGDTNHVIDALQDIINGKAADAVASTSSAHNIKRNMPQFTKAPTRLQAPEIKPSLKRKTFEGGAKTNTNPPKKLSRL